MVHNTRKDPSALNRREAIAIMSAFGVSPTFAATPTRLHEMAAAKAKELAQGKPMNLRLLVPTGTGRSIDVILGAFKDASGITIEKIESPLEDISTDLALDFLSASNQFDLALPATFAVSDLAHSGAILPVSTYAKRYEPAGFRDGILYDSGDTIMGDIYGFQADGDAYLMFYNKGMLEDPQAQYDYALDYGTTLAWPRTWAELDRQTAFFHRPEQGQYGGLLFRTAGYVAWEWWVRFHAKGLWPFSSQMEALIASDEGVAALEDMIAVTEFLHPDVGNLNLFSNWETYAEGNTFANIGWGGSQKHFQSKTSKIKGNIIYGPTPGGVVGGQLLTTPYFNWGWTYVVTSSCKTPEIGYLFNLFASSPEISTLSVRQSDGFFDPFRPEHYDDPGIQTIYSPDFLKVHRKSLETSIPDLYLRRQGDYFQVLGEWIYRALSREIPPKVALETVAQRWDAITRTVGKSRQVQSWHALKNRYPSNVRKLLKEVS